MTTFIEYEIEEGVTILVKAAEDEPDGMITKAARGQNENVVIKAGVKFADALESIRLSALAIKRKLDDARADEVQVKFGLTTTGKLGNFAVGEVGISANYEVTLTWKNPPAAAGK